MLATILFTDIVGSTARLAELGDTGWQKLLDQHHAVVRRQLSRFRGPELNTTGDGFFASSTDPREAFGALCPSRVQIPHRVARASTVRVRPPSQARR